MRPSPDVRAQRICATHARPPLTGGPFGRAIGRIAALLWTVSTLSCSSTSARPVAPWCVGQPVDFGAVELRNLQFHVVDSNWRGARSTVRFRRDAFLLRPGDWVESGTDDAGAFSTADWPSGRYEIEICGANARPIHGWVNVVADSPIADVTFVFRLGS